MLEPFPPSCCQGVGGGALGEMYCDTRQMADASSQCLPTWGTVPIMLSLSLLDNSKGDVFQGLKEQPDCPLP